MTGDAVDVSVIIVSWNTRALTHACLASLPGAAEDLAWEAVVVDNASTDDSVATIRQTFPAVEVIANATNVGFAAANNQGLRIARGRYYLLLNSDTVMEPGSMARLVRFADARPRAGVVGPLLLNPDGSMQSGPTPFPSVWSETLSVTGLGKRIGFVGYPSRGPRHSRSATRTDYVMGACMLARRQAVEEVGPLDEGYFMYSEEPDWCWRMRARGWETWFAPEARVVHFGGQSTGQIRDAMVLALYRSKVRFIRRYRGRTSAALLVGIVVASRGARAVVRRLRGQPGGVVPTPRELLQLPDPDPGAAEGKGSVRN